MPKKVFEIPYYTSTIKLQVDEKNFKGVITPHKVEKSSKSEAELVLESLCNPIDSPRLRDLSAGKKKIVLITCDHTRSMPSKITIPLILEEIRSGAPDAQISILIATGTHRVTTVDEQKAMFGEEFVKNETIIVHDAYKAEDMRKVCTLPSGAVLSVNHRILDCDLLIAEGFIEPHLFAGYSGGRKSILPGLASLEAVNINHSYRAISSPYARTGVLENNPLHIDMLVAARAVKLAFIMNVALDINKKIIAAFSGNMETAHYKGVEFVDSLAKCPAIIGDIIVTSNGGYPLDQNLYQASKGMTTAEMCTGESAVIIVCASCVDGIGGENLQEWLISGTPDEIDKRISVIPPEKTFPDQWVVQMYARVLKKHTVILVTTNLDPDLIIKANLIPAASLDEALETAYSIKGKDAGVVVIPDGVAVVIG